MDQDTGEKWRGIQRETKLEIKTPEELLRIFQIFTPDGSTVQRERFEQKEGVLVEKKPKLLKNFRTVAMGEDNVHLMWGESGNHFGNFNGEQKVAIQEHDDGRKSIITSQDSKENPGTIITKRYTVA